MLTLPRFHVQQLTLLLARSRRKWLFSDTVAGANAAANLYSLVQTCKANSIEPYHYLIGLFKGLPHAHTADYYEALLPWRLNPHVARPISHGNAQGTSSNARLRTNCCVKGDVGLRDLSDKMAR